MHTHFCGPCEQICMMFVVCLSFLNGGGGSYVCVCICWHFPSEKNSHSGTFLPYFASYRSYRKYACI